MQDRHAHDLAQNPEATQGRERLFDAGLREMAGGCHAFAERAKRFLVENRTGRAAQTFVNDETDRVRPDVDDRDWLGPRWRSGLLAIFGHRAFSGHPAV